MTQPPPPPPPPSPEALARLRQENEALTAQLTNEALRDANRALADGGRPGAAGRPGAISVVKDARGYVVVTAPGRPTVEYDPKVGLDNDQVQELVQTALAPPRGRTPGQDAVAILGVVMPFALMIVVAALIAQAFARRSKLAGARAQGAPADVGARLARIEQALEAVAVEVERIAEAERYSARLLTERLPAVPALGEPTVEAPPRG